MHAGDCRESAKARYMCAYMYGLHAMSTFTYQRLEEAGCKVQLCVRVSYVLLPFLMCERAWTRGVNLHP